MPIFLGLLTVLVQAGSLLVLSGTMQVWPVGQAGTYSRLLTLVILGAWIGATGRGWRRFNVTCRTRWLVLMGVVSIVTNLLWFSGMQWTMTTNAALLTRLDLLFVIFIGSLLGVERISRQGLVVVPVMFMGLLLVMEVQRLDWTVHLLGDLMIVFSALGLAINAFVIRQILQRMDEVVVAFYNYAASTIGFAVLACIQGWALPPVVDSQPVMWWWILLLAAVSAVALPLYYAALHRLVVWKLRVLLLLVPMVTAVADWIIWRHRLHGLQWLGAAMLIGGAAALVWAEARLLPQREATVSANKRCEELDPI